MAKFSKRSVLADADFLENQCYARITRFLLEQGLDIKFRWTRRAKACSKPVEDCWLFRYRCTAIPEEAPSEAIASPWEPRFFELKVRYRGAFGHMKTATKTLYLCPVGLARAAVKWRHIGEGNALLMRPCRERQ